ncbi:hypothetical protein P5G51_008555 [Virgibacillus sp. 179-BFC.A HS]|uniref:ATP-grasp fold RimK-type domain-containing protein n=1 Tax=Tigheibacillus jepli TaxID=3035914 RepID=A0ABU5CGJ5_9BACI|nr:hypothetical protein [Virgibacillus sp. 179-BFC.A HS]MDY0405441.1 hypothetical protein [Virgibacillus sp. 179-BFC.A HS]
MHAVRDASSWEMLLPTLPKVDIVIQDCDVRLGRDIRVFVVGKEIIGAVLRKNNNDFRANFKLGGSAESYSLNDSERDIVQTIINHFHFGMVGIDFLMDHQGKLLFNEIEDVVGSRTLSATSNINIVKKYIQWIKDQMR